jgi:hypothetical protein
MAKEFKTRGELHKLVLDEARKSAACADAPDIIITGPFPSREFTWDMMRRPGAAAIPAACAKELEVIVRRLQTMFEISGD